MSDGLYSTPAQLDQLAHLVQGYLRLPFSNGLLPGQFMESVIALIKSGKVLRTYDFVDVINSDTRVGWQVKCTKESTPVTWKRAKIPNAAMLIEESRSSAAKTQELGQKIVDFCNQHALNSLEKYSLERIGYCRVVVRKNDILYFEREILSPLVPRVFEPAKFRWEWSERKRSSSKEMLPALHGIHEESGEKWFAAHILGENQLHFSGEKRWWPTEDSVLPVATVPLPSESERIDFDRLLAWFAKFSDD
ncbi:MAG: hypothetical protein OXH86_06425 [Acidimicrobiaceae bacterium]|nr:hypothetical protein [Acidimicrobiaceae bacterium]